MTTVKVELDIEEVMELIGYHHKMYESIPKERYFEKTLAGTTFGDTANKYLRRREFWNEVLNTNWPK